MYYVITLNGLLVGVTKENAYTFNLPNVSIHEFDGIIPDLNNTIWDETAESLITDIKILTKLAFLNRFTMSERMSIRASTDPIVFDIMNLLQNAEYVNVNDQNTMQGVGYLAMIGLIANERVAEILT